MAYTAESVNTLNLCTLSTHCACGSIVVLVLCQLATVLQCDVCNKLNLAHTWDSRTTCMSPLAYWHTTAMHLFTLRSTDPY